MEDYTQTQEYLDAKKRREAIDAKVARDKAKKKGKEALRLLRKEEAKKHIHVAAYAKKRSKKHK
jgi:hypothetical protein